MQLIDATRMYSKMKKSLGNKRVYMTDEQIAEVVGVYAKGATDVSRFRWSTRSRSRLVQSRQRLSCPDWCPRCLTPSSLATAR